MYGVHEQQAHSPPSRGRWKCVNQYLAKALALGADDGTMARPFLLKAHDSEEALDSYIADTLTELRICMFGAGAGNLLKLKGTLASQTYRKLPLLPSSVEKFS